MKNRKAQLIILAKRFLEIKKRNFSLNNCELFYKSDFKKRIRSRDDLDLKFIVQVERLLS